MGGIGRVELCGHTPSSVKSSKRPTTQTQKTSRLRYARRAGARGIRLRRQRANRSIAVAKNGNRQAISTSSMAHPRIRREPRYRYVDVPRVNSRPSSSVPSASCAARPTWASLSARNWSLVSLTGSGGLSPAVVSVTAAMPCARNGACSYREKGKPRSISWRSALGRAGSRPVCAAMRAAIVCRKIPEGSRGMSPPNSSRIAPAASDRVQVDDSGDVVAKLVVSREPGGAYAPECAPIRREKEDRVVRTQLAGGQPARCAVRARELNQHRSSRSVVIRARAASVVVAMRHDDDRARRRPDRFGHDVLQLDPSASRV